MSELWQRIKFARKNAKLTQEQIGEAFVPKISRAAVAQWEAKDPEKRTQPKYENLKTFSKLTKAPMGWLLSDEAELNADFFYSNQYKSKSGKYLEVNERPSHSTATTNDHEPNTEPGPDISGQVPLISWVQAGHWQEVIDNYAPGDGEDWVPTTAKVSKNAFALRVQGDSMVNPHGAPSVPEGYIIIVDPKIQANNGDLVVARLDDSMEATFKKLVIDGNKCYLKALNPAYPVIEINGNCTICGKVVKVEYEP